MRRPISLEASYFLTSFFADFVATRREARLTLLIVLFISTVLALSGNCRPERQRNVCAKSNNLRNFWNDDAVRAYRFLKNCVKNGNYQLR